jgi:hypothetical protein
MTRLTGRDISPTSLGEVAVHITTPLSICRGFAANLHLVIQAAAAGQFKEAATWVRPPRLRSDLSFSGFAGVSLGAGRTQRARGSCGPRRTCRSGRSGKAAVFYHHFSLILPGGDFDYASGGELRSNPTKPSSQTALDLHCFAWADFNTHAVLARSSNPSDDH